MTSEKIIVGDTGIPIEVEILFGDLDTATKTEFHVISPTGILKTWTATIVGPKIRYVSVDGDLNEPGTWRVVPYIEWGPEQHQHFAAIYLEVYKEGT